MKIIKSRCGLHDILVDDEDYEFLVEFANSGRSTWHSGWGINTICRTMKNGESGSVLHYAKKGKRKTGERVVCYSMHRLVLGITDSKIKIDHKDGNGLNNQKYNLRTATSQQNTANSEKPLSGRLTYKGVTHRGYGRGKGHTIKKFRARIRVNDRLFSLGNYHTEVEAAVAYNEAAKKHFGEFARLNEIRQ